VTALTRNATKARDLASWGVEAVVADLASSDWHAQIAPDAEFVLDCVSSGGGGVEGYRRSYVEGLRSILTWVDSSGPGVLVYTSSTSVYPQDGGARVLESASTEGASGSAQVLLEAEALVARWPGPRSCVLRLAGIYGPGRHYLLDALRAGESTVAGRGDFHLNLAHRDDIVEAIFAAFGTAEARGVFNISDDGAAPKAELVAWLAARLGKPVPVFTGEPAAGRRAVTPDRIILNDRARQVLGWRPRYPSFREGYAPLLEA
jgi:nucleoside-diphosphate-sugar epimerase